jgi:hAT family C-terminal dimerisation region
MGISDDNERDKFRKYAYTDPTAVVNLKTFNLINWWNNTRFQFPSLHLWAFDTLAIPVISAEYERVFSSVKKLITPERSRLHAEIIEVSECLKN